MAVKVLANATDNRFEGFLTDGFGELLPNHGRRRLSGTEPGEPYTRGVSTRCFFLCFSNGINRHGYLNVAVDSGRFLGADFDVHIP